LFILFGGLLDNFDLCELSQCCFHVFDLGHAVRDDLSVDKNRRGS